MLRGHSYDFQVYYSLVDRLVNNLFLNGKNGILKDEGNACKMSVSANTITILDGFIMLQGGITEVVSSESISTNLENAYCRLVYEIDMSRTNSKEEFNQGRFRILTGSNSYPSLTQQKMTKNSGIYQYELAQFRSTTTGITDFVDKRTFLDYQSIFDYVEEEVKKIEAGSIFVNNETFNTLKDTVDILDDRPIVVVQNSQPVPIPGKTIVWLKPKS